MDERDNVFNLYLSRMTDLYYEDPKKRKIIDEYYDKMMGITKRKIDTKVKEELNKNLHNNAHIITMVLLFVLILIVGLVGLPDPSIYIFGFIFFVAGLLVGMFIPGFGIIFLFSHGLSGILTMTYSAELGMESPLLSDFGISSFSNMTDYFAILFLISAIACAIVYSFMRKRLNRFACCLPPFFILLHVICRVFSPYLSMLIDKIL